MKAPKVLLTDVDGVLLSWTNSFDKFASSLGYDIDPTKYLASERCNTTIEQGKNLVKEFNHNKHYMANLEPLADSVKYVSELVEDGYIFAALTSVSDDPDIAECRSKNLKNIFGDVFIEVKCIGMGSDKSSDLCRMRDQYSSSIWVEDHPRNALKGVELDLQTFLVSAPYNSDFEHPEILIAPENNPWEFICREVKNEK